MSPLQVLCRHRRQCQPHHRCQPHRVCQLRQGNEIWLPKSICNVIFQQQTKTKKNCYILFRDVLTLSLPESNLDSISVVVHFESVDKTRVCDHSNESYCVLHSSCVDCF